MDISFILNDPALKAKAKVTKLGTLLADKEIKVSEILKHADGLKDASLANCVESLELATRLNSGIATPSLLAFATEQLMHKAPRVKWEAAKVIGNIAHHFPSKLNDAINNLLVNAEYPGTVVRWSAAFALGEIVKLKTKINKDLIPAIEKFAEKESQNSIRKVYLSALKKVKP